MDRIRFNSEHVLTTARKIDQCADRMEDGLHELHRVIANLEDFEDSNTIQELVGELKRLMRRYQSLQDQSYRLESALNKVCAQFEENEKNMIAFGKKIEGSTGFTITGINTYINGFYPGRVRYTDHQKDIGKAFEKLKIQQYWISSSILIPQWLIRAAENYENNRQREK